jgi:hypothetical protein
MYFSEARRLAPDDTRILGWLGGVAMALGKAVSPCSSSESAS